MLSRIRKDPSEALILVGDMGDGFSAQNLFIPAGLRDPFSHLSLPMDSTYPTRTTRDRRGVVKVSCDVFYAMYCCLFIFELHWILLVFEVRMCKGLDFLER